MKILCLVDKYYPESSANTVCCECIIEYLKKQGNKVDILSELVDIDGEIHSSYNNSNVIKFPTYHISILKKYGKVFHAKQWKDFPWFFRKSCGVLNKLKHFMRLNTEYNALDVVDYKKIAKLIGNECDYDVIISVSAPFALHVIALKLLRMGIAKRWYPLFLDPFVNNKCLNPKRIAKRGKIAENILKYAENIFMMDGIMEENMRLGFNPDYHSKVVEITMPNLSEPQNFKNIINTNNSGKIKMTYAGLFYDSIRNPKLMLELISKLPNNFELSIYGGGCEKVVNHYVKLDPQKFKFLGRIEHQLCLEKLMGSNIVINLSNTITNQMPSKVFEYISYGKPVVNFYFSENDTSLKYFKKYPLAFNLNLNSYSDDEIKNLINFCEKNKYKNLRFEEATKNLAGYRAENVCALIYNTILNGEMTK